MGIRRQMGQLTSKIAASKKSRALAAALLASTALGGAAAYAGGLGLADVSTDSVAHAYAGTGVDADPDLSYYNPAGMVLIDGTAFEQTFNIYSIHSSFTGTETAPGLSATGSTSGFVESTASPSTFNVISLPHGIKAGLSVTTPFGGRVKYNNDFVGPFQGSEALVTTIQVGLSVAIPITSQLSIGFGPVINWLQGAFAQSFNTAPFTPDSSGIFSGKGYGLGYDVGLLYQLSPATRFGLDYHSKIVQTLKGAERTDLGGLGFILGSTVPYLSTGETKWTLPQQFSFSAYQQITPELAVMASALWTDWTQQPSLIIADPSTSAVSNGSIYTPFHYRDSWTLGVGATYNLTPGLSLMSGLGYDETPVKTPYRQDLVPDANRYIIGLGANLRLTPYVNAEIAYQHMIFQNSAINQNREALLDGQIGPSPAGTGSGTLAGENKLAVDIFSAAVIGKF